MPRTQISSAIPADNLHGDESDDLRPCPSCPDGYVWNSSGQTAKCCPTCNGHAVVNLDGSPIGRKQ